ncbi:fluoride efflux transporter FluC [Aquibacillus salsiterrae]|uniref:Fluoride-specific ion channel FluC n=1 Tax=Aquibacillus salsiterrae TaxID=2950439 RepID=A0A9X3WFZ4_9BACI|nr:CrcB family protein [Aquibacillus salsiterrae]MDC3417630.1 CrcB family protein [Aquibacillus salsiterrae]
MIYVLVGLAGALGAMLRYLVGIALVSESPFPFSTLLINLIGCYLLAWLTTTLFNKLALSDYAKAAIGTGLVGSFTTFSAVSVETVLLFDRGSIVLGICYVIVSLIGGMAMSRLGFKVSRVGEKA